MAKRTLLDLINGIERNDRPIIFHENVLAALYAGNDIVGAGSSGGGFITLVNGSGPGYSPVDATPFYLVQDVGAILSGAPSTTAPAAVSITTPAMPVALTIVSVYLAIVAASPGSAETGSAAIRVNNGTDTTVFNNTVQWNAATNLFTATGLSIAVAAGSFFSLKITPPTWATDPTGTYYAAKIGYTTP